MSNNNLWVDFNSSSAEEWIAKIEKDLKGRSYSELYHKITEEISLAPAIFDHEGKPALMADRLMNDWQIGAYFRVSSSQEVKTINQQLITALEEGCDSPRIIVDSSLSGDDWDILLRDVNLSYISLYIEINNLQFPINDMLSYFKGRKDLDYKKLFILTNNATYDRMCNNAQFQCTSLKIAFDADPTKMLSFFVNAADNAFRKIANSNDIDTALNQQFVTTILITKDYFGSISLIRAMRLLWENLKSAWDIKDNQAELFINVEFEASSYAQDPYNNLIRAATMASSAIIGGCDRLEILVANTGDSPEEKKFASRIARNVQHILKLESYLDKVVDPSAGSYYIETYTDSLVENVWHKFLSSLHLNN
ncbi:MAG: hypothetical protein KBA06_02295 [Saprospiraceae bacterium]|nr:hypothetical protein [Saprospiraceae bacterium]